MNYSHLTLEERREIFILRERKLGVRAIARALNRNPSTISRELARNNTESENGNSQYSYLQANERYINQLHRQKNEDSRNSALEQYVVSRLLQRWSPEQISGRIEIDYPDDTSMRVSFATIYRWIHTRQLDVSAESVLRRRGRRPKPKINRFPGAKTMRSRPEEASKRERIGDWEMDTINSAKRDCSGILTMCDRKSRYCVIVYTRNSKSQWAVKRTIENLSAMIPVRSVTTDQGVEFSCYKRVEAEHGIPFYVCDPKSPWQKPVIENLNGLIREFFPRGTNFRNVDESEFQDAMELLNNRPRKCLKWKTPTEVLCESEGKVVGSETF